MTHPEPLEMIVGTTLGRWTLAKRLGEGAMGPVFEATSPGGTKAALHLVRRELVSTPEQHDRLRRDAKTFQKVDHPNVPRLLDVDEARGQAFLAFELVDGRSLQFRLDAGKPLSSTEGRALALDLLSALAVIHDRDFVHGDVKPGNVLMGREGCWKLSGFSLATHEGDPEAPGAHRGTPLFTSPEQAEGKPPTRRSDLYSAGATIHTALAGEPPFRRPSVGAILQAHIQDLPPDLTAKAQGLEKDLVALVSALLAKDPQRRPDGARAALSMLGAQTRRRPKTTGVMAAATVEEAPAAPEPAPAPPPEPPRSRWTMTAHRKAVDLLKEPPAPDAAPAPAAPSVPWTRRVALRFKVRWHARRGETLEQAQALSELGQFAASGELLLDAGEPGLAAEEFLKAGIPHAAAIVFERTGSHAKAIEAYVAGGKLEQAQTLAAATARFDVLGDALEKHGHLDRAIQAFGRAAKPLRVGALYEKKGNLAAAAQEFERGRDLPRAAELHERLGHVHEAARLFERAGQLARVAQVYETAGDGTNAARWRAEQELAEGRRLNAAKAFEKAGIFDRAVGLYLAQNLIADAVRCADALGDPGRAAPVHEKAGDVGYAASLYEAAGLDREAARCHRKLGDRPAEAAALERAHDALAAAEVWEAASRPDDARRALAAVPPGAPDRKRARARLGTLEVAAGHVREAAEALDEALEGETPDGANVADFVACAEAHVACGQVERALEWLARVDGLPFAPPTVPLRIAELRGAMAGPAMDPSRGGKDLVGSELDRYRTGAYLGEGELSWAYDGEHTLLKRGAALRVLKPQAGEAGAERFFAEACALARLRHPNLAQVEDSGRTAQGQTYVALAVVKDPTLRQLLKEARGPLRVERALTIGTRLLGGLSAAHEAGLVHGDLKPEHVHVSLGDQVRIVGFPFARYATSIATKLSLRFAALRPYTAPEQGPDSPATPASDQYSAGVLLYELLSGVHPLANPSDSNAGPNKFARPLREIVPNVPGEVAAAVMRALERDPAKRHASVEAMKAALESATLATV